MNFILNINECSQYPRRGKGWKDDSDGDEEDEEEDVQMEDLAKVTPREKAKTPRKAALNASQNIRNLADKT